MVPICAWYAFSRVVRIGGAHSRAWCILARGTHSHAWYALARAHSRAWYVFARGAPCSRILRIAQLGIPQQLISVRFGKCDNFPDRFGSDMQKYRFNIGRFGLLFGTDYICSYCLDRSTSVSVSVQGREPVRTDRMPALHISQTPVFQYSS